MKKIFGFILLGIGIFLPGINGKQPINKNVTNQTEIKDPQKKELDKKNLTPEEEQKKIESRLKGLGYFQ